MVQALQVGGGQLLDGFLACFTALGKTCLQPSAAKRYRKNPVNFKIPANPGLEACADYASVAELSLIHI